MANPFVHVELQTQSLSQVKEFYGQLFGWNLEEVPMQGSDEAYTMIQVGEGTGGGMVKHPEPNTPSSWVPYIEVENLAESTEKARKLGATVLQDNCDVPDMGWFSIIQDPAGTITGIWQNK